MMKIDKAFGPYQVGDVIYNGVIIRQVEQLPPHGFRFKLEGDELKAECARPDGIVEIERVSWFRRFA